MSGLSSERLSGWDDAAADRSVAVRVHPEPSAVAVLRDAGHHTRVSSTWSCATSVVAGARRVCCRSRCGSRTSDSTGCRVRTRCPEHPGVVLSIESRHGGTVLPLRHLHEVAGQPPRHHARPRRAAEGREVRHHADGAAVPRLAGHRSHAHRGREGRGLRGSARIALPNENDDCQASWSQKISTHPDIARNTLRQARAKAHPDRHGGDQDLWNHVEGAAKVLGLA